MSDEPAPAQPPQGSTKRRVFFEGRYRKLVRDLPQTIFYCPECKGRGCKRCEGFGKLTKDSVQELIARVAMPLFRAGRHKHKFHGAGREDIDVRMLGGGRPFVFEIIDPREPQPNLAELERRFNERYAEQVELCDLRWCKRPRVAEVKEGKHAKEYGLRVAPETPVSLDPLREREGQRIVVAQRTPSRVAHRRADLVRERWIEIQLGEQAEDGEFTLRIRSEHGTYIKEVVSGDEQRSRPSIAEWLGVACTCKELDVLDLLSEGGAPLPEPVVGVPLPRAGVPLPRAGVPLPQSDGAPIEKPSAPSPGEEL